MCLGHTHLITPARKGRYATDPVLSVWYILQQLPLQSRRSSRVDTCLHDGSLAGEAACVQHC